MDQWNSNCRMILQAFLTVNFLLLLITLLRFCWDEIQNFEAFPCSCTCDINEKLTKHQLQESVMQFLKGLNESYAQI